MPIFAGIGTALLGTGGVAAAGATGTAIVGGLATAAAVGGATYAVSSSRSAAKAAKTQASIMAGTQGITGTANPETTVDPTANNQNQINQLGRAALISTSPQGVQGTDNVGRYRLLGN